ncbi:MAG TPA: hypothetical protein VHJ76_05135 [Actinomycetota bacterium]|nr:hypothetical protein [Actinomycetota bacterium]
MLCLACSLVAAAQLTVNPPVADAAERATPRVTLAGTTTILGSTTGAIDVHLPKRVTLDGAHALHRPTGPNEDVRFVERGSGPYFGFALVEDPYPEVRREGRFLVGGQFALCDRPRCSTADTYNDYWSTGTEGGRSVLEPGDYKLLLVAEGPVEIKLKLTGLRGRTTVRPAPDDFAAIESPVPASTAVGGGELWWGGTSAYGGQVGFSISLAAAAAPEFAGGEFGICQYNVLEPPPKEVGYGPHCQAVSGVVTTGAHYTWEATGEDEELVFSTSIGYNANENSVGVPNLDGDHGIGVWANVKSKLSYLRFANVFVALDDID